MQISPAINSKADVSKSQQDSNISVEYRKLKLDEMFQKTVNNVVYVCKLNLRHHAWRKLLLITFQMSYNIIRL